jgi:pyridoxine 4-dehydrogenase
MSLDKDGHMPDASRSGTFAIGGEITIHRLGFGAMRITGPGVWGEPEDRAEAIRVLEQLPALHVNFIDTANSYGPDVSEQLIREALYPYEGMLIATKAGFERPRAGMWLTNGDPAYLRAEAVKSCDKLGVSQIALWQLHRIDPKVPREDQFAAVRGLIDDGIVRHVRLSEVSVDDIKAAQEVFPVFTVQNQSRGAQKRGRARLLRGERDRLHSLVSARERQTGEKGLGARRDRAGSWSGPEPGRARLVARPQPGDAADTGHVQGRASG